MRSIGTATISFGLVAIPVKLYTPARSGVGIRFRQLHGDGCGGRLKQQYLCVKDGEVVPRTGMVKGYEYAKDQYVTFADEEVKAAAAEATKAIEIKEFVPLAKIEPLFFDRSYYLGPDKGGAKPYRLLKEAMSREGVVGLAQYAVRGKQYLVAVRPTDEGLIMHQLYYADEIRPFSDVPMEDEVEVTEQELALALQIVQMTATDSFKPDKYEDTVRQNLNEMIDQKVDGEEVTISMAEEPRAQVVDLMAALKASLQGSAEPKQVAPRNSGEASAKESTG